MEGLKSISDPGASGEGTLLICSMKWKIVPKLSPAVPGIKCP